MKKTVAIGITICLFMIWFSLYMKNEFLTFLHGNEFIGLHESTNMIERVDYLKVLSYSSNNFARVYYVGGSGDVLEFTWDNEKWERVSWITVWSSGSADSFIWPYFYHSPEGIVFFIIIIIFISLLINIFLYLMKIIKRKECHKF